MKATLILIRDPPRSETLWCKHQAISHPDDRYSMFNDLFRLEFLIFRSWAFQSYLSLLLRTHTCYLEAFLEKKPQQGRITYYGRLCDSSVQHPRNDTTVGCIVCCTVFLLFTGMYHHETSTAG